ncbi:MAG: hypothetical protein ABJC19_10550 [Gemmatimonadota bacterium]
MMSWKQLKLMAVVGAILSPGALTAQHTASKEPAPVAVRFTEGSVHGFLELQDGRGVRIASGELLQLPAGRSIESTLTFRFADRSYFEESVTFTQQRVFALQKYHLVQRGRSFARDLDATLWSDGHYVVKSTSHDGEVTRDAGQLDLPHDVSNGLVVTLAKNLRVGDTATVHLVAFTPNPQLVELRLSFEGTDSILVGDRHQPLARFLVKPHLSALKGFFAKLLGKLPADSRIWVLQDRVPAFIRFEGPLYDGAVWRLVLAAPVMGEPRGVKRK